MKENGAPLTIYGKVIPYSYSEIFGHDAGCHTEMEGAVMK